MIRLLALIVILLAGCISRPGKSETHYLQIKANGQTDDRPIEIKIPGTDLKLPAGYDVVLSSGKATQPVPPDEPATTTADEKGSSASTGGAADSNSDGLSGAFWAGVLLVIAGGLLWISKRASFAQWIAPGPTKPLIKFAALMPRGFGLFLIGFGVFLICLQWFLHIIEPLILPLCILGGMFVGVYCWNIYKERGKKHRDDKKDPA